MLAPAQSRQALTRLFQRQSVADLATLSAALKTSSRTSVFRRLSVLGYLSSYSHAGRFYTLRHIPQFDRDGVWQHQGVCFSRDDPIMSRSSAEVHSTSFPRPSPDSMPEIAAARCPLFRPTRKTVVEWRVRP